MIKRFRASFRHFALYLRDKLSQRQFFILSSILVGLSSGLAAVVLKYFVHYIEARVTVYSENYEEFFVFAICPIIGVALTVLFIRYVLKGQFKKGTAQIVYSIAKKSSVLAPENMYTHLVTSAITVGFGGSTGLESPMVSTGSAIGSNYASTYKLSYKERTILLACGAAAGIAAAFNAPIAGVLFAVEILLTDITASAFIPLIIAAASGALVSKIILKGGIVLSFSLTQPFNYHNMPYYIVLGILAGFLSLYFARVFSWVEKKMAGIKGVWIKIVVGGVALMVLLVVFPPLFGEGYETIKILSNLTPHELTKSSVINGFITNDTHLLLFLGALMLLKTVAAALTIGSGGNGGTFGPSLFVGAYLGFIFARLVNISGLAVIPESNFTLVAMAGILSGVLYAPLTAIFLIAEITGGYELMIPLMTVAALSTVVTHYFEPLSMEAKKLSGLLKINVEDRDKFILSKLELEALIETNFSVLKPEQDIQELIKTIATSSRNIFPVLNESRELLGVVHLDKIRSIIFNASEHSNATVNGLMDAPAEVISTDENLPQALRKFEDTQQWNLPVVENNKYIGFLSKSSILTKYRDEFLKSV